MSSVTFWPAARAISAVMRSRCRLRQFLRHRDLGRDLAAAPRQLGKEMPDHLGQREEPPVLRQKPEEIACDLLQLGALGQGRDRASLLAARDDRAADHAAQIGALGQKRAHARKIARHRVERAALVGEREKRSRVAFGKPAFACRFGCHVPPIPARVLRSAASRRRLSIGLDSSAAYAAWPSPGKRAGSNTALGAGAT